VDLKHACTGWATKGKGSDGNPTYVGGSDLQVVECDNVVDQGAFLEPLDHPEQHVHCHQRPDSHAEHSMVLPDTAREPNASGYLSLLKSHAQSPLPRTLMARSKGIP